MNGIPPPAPRASLPTPSSPRATHIVAHRGGARLWPENTLRAFHGALALGVDAVECDVHPSADGVTMVVHDPTLDRTGQGTGPVVARTAAELQAAPEALPPEERAFPLTTLLELLAPTAMTASVELKADVDGACYPRLAAQVVADLRATGMIDRAFVHTFDWDYLLELEELSPGMPLGANVEAETLARFAGWDALLDAIVGLKVRDLNADHRLVDEEVIAKARARGLGVTLWTVNDDDAIRRFLAAGVDYLCTDRPDRALVLRAEAAAETAASA